MIYILSLIAGVIYCIRYKDRPRPPVRDVISPLVLIFMAVEVMWSKSLCMYVGAISLLLDAIADYTMNVEDLATPLTFFSIGHLMRQSAFVIKFFPDGLFIVLITITVLVLLAHAIDNPTWDKWVIILYTCIVALTLLNISLMNRSLNIGMMLFAASDLMIAYELVFGRMKRRRIRVLVVPILFWMAEFMTMYELGK